MTDAFAGLTFSAFRSANVTRCLKWHPAGLNSWSPSDWLTAVTGELGELASLLKMRNRERDGLVGNKFSPTDKQIADELADVLTYLDLLAAVLGVDLGRASAQKFNEVSERNGFPDRIALIAQGERPPADSADLVARLEGRMIHRWPLPGLDGDPLCMEAAAALREQGAEIDRLRRDAERYIAWRDAYCAGMRPFLPKWLPVTAETLWTYPHTAETWHGLTSTERAAAIDAAWDKRIANPTP